MGLNQGHTGVWYLCLMSCTQSTTTRQRVTPCSAPKGHPTGQNEAGQDLAQSCTLGAELTLPCAPCCHLPEQGLCYPRSSYWNQPGSSSTLQPQQCHPAATAVSSCSHGSVILQPQQCQPQQCSHCVLTEQTVLPQPLPWALPFNGPSQPSNQGHPVPELNWH